MLYGVLQGEDCFCFLLPKAYLSAMVLAFLLRGNAYGCGLLLLGSGCFWEGGCLERSGRPGHDIFPFAWGCNLVLFALNGLIYFAQIKRIIRCPEMAR